jgi:hypothetical protein
MEDTEAKQNLIGEGGRYPRGRKSARAIDIADRAGSRGAEASQLLAGLKRTDPPKTWSPKSLIPPNILSKRNLLDVKTKTYEE